MTGINNSVIARYKSGSNTFEIMVDCDKAMDFKKGNLVEITDVLSIENIFSDSKKGMEASPEDIKKAFDTEDKLEAAKQIIKKGDIQLTAEYKNKVREVKRKKIINIIHRNGVDPRTHAPHPLTRIDAAVEDAKLKIDEHRSAEEQVHDVLKQLQPILPIKLEIKEMEITVPGKYTGKTYPLLKSFSKITKEEWRSDGSHYAIIEIPGGLEEEFLNKINSITHGDNQVQILNTR